MRFSGWRFWSLVGVFSLIAGGLSLHAETAVKASTKNKVLIYPTSKDSLAELQRQGIDNVRNYGTYWLAEATDEQFAALKQRHPDRVVKANYLNKIELNAMAIDTTLNEPNIPAQLRETPTTGKRLRLIQFVGPVEPEWLTAVKAAGDARVVAYIPNNAYVVWLDADAEKKLAASFVPNGPIQWLSPYHPYYKFPQAMAESKENTITVTVGVVGGPGADETIAGLQAFNQGPRGAAGQVREQKVVRLVISPGDLPQLAQVPDVLWIDQVRPMQSRDETQALILASRTNQVPGHSPLPGIDNYMDFLTNQVGFSTSPEQYPVLDVADTLFSSEARSDFFVLGNPLSQTRSTGLISLCAPSAILCDDHADHVTSVAVGANLSTAATNLDGSGFRLGLGVSPFGRFANTIIFSLQNNQCLVCSGDFQPVANTWNFITLNQYVTHQARISNNSWGQIPVVGNGGNSGIYDDSSLAFDIAVRDAVETGVTTNNTTPGPSPLNQELITVFAGGNAGASSGSGGFVDVITTPPATAKNIITVGSSDSVRSFTETTVDCGLPADAAANSYDVSFFSSFGPTVDGRFKPEIVAPGTAIFAVQEAFPDVLYNCENGTSFAAPAVSGGAQLLWWYFQNRLQNEQGRFYLQPSPAMTKAYLCNSARYLPITDPESGTMDTLPSIAQGMGIMDLARMFDGVPRVVRDESTPRAINTPLITTNPVPQQTYFNRSGQSYEVKGAVADPTNPFRVTLAWTDAPGNPASFKQLVNDLDLEVTIGGQVYKGNVFSGPNSVPNVGSADSVNNIESVFLPPGQTGTWSVVVRAIDIAGNGVPNVGSGIGQDFALVVYNAANTPRSDVPNLSTNDSCQTALEIDNFPFVFTNGLNKAVYHNTHPSPSAGTGGVEEFFKLPNPTPGTTFTVDTFGSTFDTVLSVWQVNVFPQTILVRGECGALEEIVSDNDAANGTNQTLQSKVSFTANGSNDYFIVVEPHNDGDGGTMVLNVAASASGITLTPSSLSFSDQIQGTTSSVQTVTYQNGDPISVRVGSVLITGDDAADFEIVSQTCEGDNLVSGTNCFVSVAFVPQTNGVLQANLVFNDNATGSPRVVPLSGNGTPPAPLVCLGAGSLVFSNTAIGSISAPQTLVVTNCGTDLLDISTVTKVGFASNEFNVVSDTCSGSSIAPGDTCSLTITFAPQNTGNQQITLIIPDNTAGGQQSVTLSGVGFVPVPGLCVTPGVVNFGNVSVGLTGLVQTLIITNCGTAGLVISNTPTVTGGNSNDFLVVSSTCTNTIATGDTCQVSLQFAPTAGGVRSASLSFVDNIPGAPQLVSLIGNGDLSLPDGAIGKTTNVKKMLGAGIINTTGAGQELQQSIRRGARQPVRFFVTLRNVGSAPDRFTLQGDGNDTGFTVNYFLGAVAKESVDVTSAVESGAFSSSTLAPTAITGNATMIRVEVFAADKTVLGKNMTKTFKLTFSSVSDPTKVDVVKATVKTK